MRHNAQYEFYNQKSIIRREKDKIMVIMVFLAPHLTLFFFTLLTMQSKEKI